MDATVFQPIRRLHHCPICARIYMYPMSLQKHMLIHAKEDAEDAPTPYTPERSFECDLCSATFRNGVQLKFHRNRHCSLCQKSFASSSTLHVHVKKHLGAMPFKCTLCKYSFACAYTLEKHMQRHLGIKEHRCNFCEKAFVTSYELKSHMRRLHTYPPNGGNSFEDSTHFTLELEQSPGTSGIVVKEESQGDSVNDDLTLPTLDPKLSESHSDDAQVGFFNDHASLHTWNSVVKSEPQDDSSESYSMPALSLETSQSYSDIIVKMEPEESDFIETTSIQTAGAETSQSYSDIVKLEPEESDFIETISETVEVETSQSHSDIFVKLEPQENDIIETNSMHSVDVETSQSFSDIIIKLEPQELDGIENAMQFGNAETSQSDSDIVVKLEPQDSDSIENFSMETLEVETSQGYSDIVVKQEPQEHFCSDVSQSHSDIYVKLEAQENDTILQNEDSSMHALSLETSQSFSDMVVKLEPQESVSSDFSQSNFDVAYQMDAQKNDFIDNSSMNFEIAESYADMIFKRDPEESLTSDVSQDIIVEEENEEKDSNDYSARHTLKPSSSSAPNIVVKMEENLCDEEISDTGGTTLPYNVDVGAAVKNFLTLKPSPNGLSFFPNRGSGIGRKIMIANVSKMKIERKEPMNGLAHNDVLSFQRAAGEEEVNNIHIEDKITTNESHTNGEYVAYIPKIDRRRVGNESHKCKFCEMTFTTRNRLEAHTSKAHTNEGNPLKCLYCGLVATNTYNLQLHTEWHHTRLKSMVSKNDFSDGTIDITPLPDPERQHECFVCGHSFVNAVGLVIHMQNLHPQITTPYRCMQCEKGFKTIHELKEHKRTHLTANTDKCPYCPKTFPTTYGLTKHVRTHLDAIVLKCTNCEEVCTSVAELNIHMKQHVNSAADADKPPDMGETLEFLSGTEDGDSQMSLTETDPDPASQNAATFTRFKCNYCATQCDSSAHLISHLKKHLSEARNRGVQNFQTASELVGKESVIHKCPLCKETFLVQYALKQHLKTHKDHRPYECNFCEKSFRSPSCIRSHLRTHTKIIDCSFCGKRFSSNSALNDHMHTHRELRPHKCTFCEKSYTSVNALLTHLHRKHLDADTFKCPSCQKTFSRAPELNRHLRRHLGIKPFKCAGCLKTFAELQDLRDHINRKYKLGAGKMYACDYCEDCFYEDYELRMHLKEHKRNQMYNCSLCDETFKTVDEVAKHKNTHSPKIEQLSVRRPGHLSYADQLNSETANGSHQGQEEEKEELQRDYNNIDVEDYVTRLTKIVPEPILPLCVRKKVGSAPMVDGRQVGSFSKSATEFVRSSVDSKAPNRKKVTVRISAILNPHQLVASSTSPTVAKARVVSIGGQSGVLEGVGKAVNGMDVDPGSYFVPVAQFPQGPFQIIRYKSTGATKLGGSLKENKAQNDGVAQVNKAYNGLMTRDETTPSMQPENEVEMEEEYLSDIEFLSGTES